MGRAHYGHEHDATSRTLRAQWNANPNTACMATNCKGWGRRTLAEHPNTTTGKPPAWEAGHVIAGQRGGPYRPEVQVCNRGDGGRMARAKESSGFDW